MIRFVETSTGGLEMVVGASHWGNYSQLPDWVKDFISSQPLSMTKLSKEGRRLLAASRLTFSPSENGKDYYFLLDVPSHSFYSNNQTKHFPLASFSMGEMLSEGGNGTRQYEAFRRIVFDFWTMYLQQANPFFAEGEL